MNFALYIISAAISIRLYLYMVSKNLISSSLLVVTEVEGGSILCAEYGRTCGCTFRTHPQVDIVHTSIVMSSLVDAA
jgi:hypothetical protein